MTDRGPVRAILASEFWPGATARGIAPGLRAAGWLVDEIDDQRFFPNSMSLAQRLEARLRRRQRTADYQAAILAAARTHRAEVMITVKGGNVTQATLAQLRDMGVFVVNYYPDFHFNDVPIKRMADYDLVATTKSFHLAPLAQHLPDERFVFINHGYTAELHRPVAPTPNREPVDVLYIGNAGAYKARLMIALAATLPDLKIRVVGHRWLDHAKGTALAAAVSGNAMTGDYYAAEIANAKIVLAFHMGPDRYTGVEDLVSTRTFEIPACGGFMLHVDNPEVRSLFDVPSEIDTFANDAEMIAKIGYWLDHPQEREAVAARGHARAVPAYSYTERGREIARIVEERLARR